MEEIVILFKNDEVKIKKGIRYYRDVSGNDKWENKS